MAALDGAARAAPEVAGKEPPEPSLVEPDLEFIHRLRDTAGGTFKKCFQCGTCSGTCALSPDVAPFPRKEMAWAAWGLKDRLLKDPDVWLCHQCNDCQTACPRGGRPGDVLAAVRRECVRHYAFPRFLARWVDHPRYIPLLLAIPALLLSLALLASKPVAETLGITRSIGEPVVFSYSSELPHWVLNSFFSFFGVLVFVAVIVGVVRFWRGMKAADAHGPRRAPARGMVRSILTALTKIFRHDDFAECTSARTRYPSHYLVLFGFLALCVVTLSVITARYNPFFDGAFIYPYSFWSPWKVLANLGGTAILVGGFWMLVARLKDRHESEVSAYPDWVLIWALLLVTLSGFATELLHYIRLEPHRHAVYFVHLIFVFSFLVYLPYSKLAHVVYRTTAMVYAERTGRRDAPPAAVEPAEGDAS